MPAGALDSIPRRSELFIDANIFVYWLLKQSTQCRNLLERCAREEVYGVTTLDAVNEATHRLMLEEARKRGIIGKETKNPVAALKRRPRAVAGLRTYWTQTECILDLNIVLLPTSEAHIRQAQQLRSSHGLLTRDSVLVAAMREYHLTSLASNDGDFDRVPGLTRYEPKDLPGSPQ